MALTRPLKQTSGRTQEATNQDTMGGPFYLMRDVISNGQTLQIPVGYQLLLDGPFTIEDGGILDCEGKLVIL